MNTVPVAPTSRRSSCSTEASFRTSPETLGSVDRETADAYEKGPNQAAATPPLPSMEAFTGSYHALNVPGAWEKNLAYVSRAGFAASLGCLLGMLISGSLCGIACPLLGLSLILVYAAEYLRNDLRQSREQERRTLKFIDNDPMETYQRSLAAQVKQAGLDLARQDHAPPESFSDAQPAPESGSNPV
jgi:hypothetical protein